MYAHNIVVDTAGHATLLDYGALPSDAKWTCALPMCVPGRPSGLSAQCRPPAGASFFYRPGTLPYEAQEVRAFGLFLTDLVARVQPSSHAETRRALTNIVTECLLDKPLQRPGFKALAARLADIKQVRWLPLLRLSSPSVGVAVRAACAVQTSCIWPPKRGMHDAQGVHVQ